MRGFIWGVCGFIRGHAWFYSGACMVLFGGACVVLFGGVCVVLFGGACVVLFGGMHGFIRGACMVAPGERVWLLGGHAWLLPGGCAWLLWGGCVVSSMRYSQWAGGTHPTGMHSCYTIMATTWSLDPISIEILPDKHLWSNAHNINFVFYVSRKRF